MGLLEDVALALPGLMEESGLDWTLGVLPIAERLGIIDDDDKEDVPLTAEHVKMERSDAIWAALRATLAHFGVTSQSLL